MSENASRIILALDVDSVGKGKGLIGQVGTNVRMVKIGRRAISAQIAGQMVEIARANGLEVMWDGKDYDIPATIADSIRAAVARDVQMVNVFASATVEGLMAAVAASEKKAIVLAVTELTSARTEDVEIFSGLSRKASVLLRARMASYAGCGGIVCSPQELEFLASFYGPKVLFFPEVQLDHLIKVVPGTRSVGVEANDQKNVDTPERAIINGAHWLVVGREITANSKGLTPAEAAVDLNTRIARALAERKP